MTKRIGRWFQDDDIPLGQELLSAQGVMSRRVVVVKQPLLVLLKLSSLFTQRAKYMPQDLFVDFLIDHQTLWQEIAAEDAPHIEERDQQYF